MKLKRKGLITVNETIKFDLFVCLEVTDFVALENHYNLDFLKFYCDERCALLDSK